jgi:hypothetical protein
MNVFAVLRTASMQYVARHRERTTVEFPNSWNVTCKEAWNGDYWYNHVVFYCTEKSL